MEKRHLEQKTRGLSKAEKARYVHSSIEATKRVKPGPDADALLGLECLLHQRILMYSDEQSVVVDESADWSITVLDAADKFRKLSPSAQGRLAYAAATVLFGSVPTVRCLNPSLDQLKRGSILALEYYLQFHKALEAASGFTRWYLPGGSLCGCGMLSIVYLLNTLEMTTKLLGVNGASVFEFIDLCDFDLHHERYSIYDCNDFIITLIRLPFKEYGESRL